MAQFECADCQLIEDLNSRPDACSACGGRVIIDARCRDLAAKEAAIIAEQNDRFRVSWGADHGVPGKIVVTPGIVALGPVLALGAIARASAFAEFSEDNDPFGYHDFGTFNLTAEHRVYWKIDLYDADFLFGAENPTSPRDTRRCLTLMLASEY